MRFLFGIAFGLMLCLCGVVGVSRLSPMVDRLQQMEAMGALQSEFIHIADLSSQGVDAVLPDTGDQGGFGSSFWARWHSVDAMQPGSGERGGVSVISLTAKAPEKGWSPMASVFSVGERLSRATGPAKHFKPAGWINKELGFSVSSK